VSTHLNRISAFALILCGSAHAESRVEISDQVTAARPAHIDFAIVVPTYSLIQLGSIASRSVNGVSDAAATIASGSTPLQPELVQARVTGNAGTLLVEASSRVACDQSDKLVRCAGPKWSIDDECFETSYKASD